MSYDVFISFKNSGKDGKATPDATAARGVYDALKSAGMKVFFSEESLAEVGKGQFGKSIETALESARVLILVASCREHIESPWVETEWDSFLQTVRSGHKQGELFIFNCGDLKPADLPLFLRRQQMFTQNSMEKLLQFVASAVPTLPTLGDFIQVALHCLRPEKNEDKVYLVTVHPGTTASTCHVTAHWGARTAKRLSSQMKAINVSKAVAATEVEKAKQEKLRGGYLPAAYAKLLTDEARSHLSASLGLVEAEQASKAKGKSQPKEKSDAGKGKPAKVMDTTPVKKLKQPTKVELKPDTKVVPKPSKKQLPADVGIAKTKVSKEAVKPALAKATVAAKLPDKKSTAKKVVAVPKKQAAKILTDEAKKLPPKVAKSTPQKTAAKKVTKVASPAPLKPASKNAVKTAITPTATAKTPSRRR
ncbi:MAG: TIR domain-containing protein [Betaproteobacteria bacterium]